jgi:uncharacterized protein involved in oxidation of intracellular sulfur
MTNKKITLLIATSPVLKTGAYSAARIALTAAMDGLDTTVALMEDGVYCALKGQDHGKNYEVVNFLEDFIGEGGTLHVCGGCLKKRGISEDSLISGAKVTNLHELVERIANCDQTVYFGA